MIGRGEESVKVRWRKFRKKVGLGSRTRYDRGCFKVMRKIELEKQGEKR